MSQTTQIIITIFIIAVVVGGGIFLWQRNQIKPSVEQSSDQIVGEWLTYENQAEHYSIQYPADWYFVDQQKSPDPALIDWVYFRRIKENGVKMFDFVDARVYSEKSQEYLEQSQLPGSFLKESNGKFYVISYMANNHIEETKEIFDKMAASFKIENK